MKPRKKTSLKHFFTLLILCLSPAHAWSVEDGEMTFCKFGPKFKMFEPVVTKGNTWGSNDSCSGTVKVQGVYWECTNPSLVTPKVTEFKDKLRKQAIEECQKHCSRRGRSCMGRLITSGRCGLQTDRDDAAIMGKRMGCRSDCSGQAFAYCSLYDAAFQSEDSSRIAKQAPNCQCKLEK